MDNKAISSWIRQARHRAKKQNIYSDLEIDDIHNILKNCNACAYCQCVNPDTLDHPFPLKDHVPNVPANITLICKTCKTTKKNNDLIWMYASGAIAKDVYIKLLSELFSRRGGDEIKNHVRKLSGYNGREE